MSIKKNKKRSINFEVFISIFTLKYQQACGYYLYTARSRKSVNDPYYVEMISAAKSITWEYLTETREKLSSEFKPTADLVKATEIIDGISEQLERNFTNDLYRSELEIAEMRSYLKQARANASLLTLTYKTPQTLSLETEPGIL